MINFKSIVLILVFVLQACTTLTPLPNQAYQSFLGKEIYVLVLSKSNAQKDSTIDSTECHSDKTLCATINQIKQTEIATVLVHSNVALRKVAIPSSELIQPNDIIKIYVPSNQHEIPRYIELGAKSADRYPGICDWVDGDSRSYKGGVECNGWSYKESENPLNFH